MNKLYLAITILLTAYGQLALKWRLDQIGSLPQGIRERFAYLMMCLIDPIILSTFMAAFIASLTWMSAISTMSLSVAYPLTALTYVVVSGLSVMLLKEPIGLYKAIGIALIVAGASVIANSKA